MEEKRAVWGNWSEPDGNGWDIIKSANTLKVPRFDAGYERIWYEI